MAGEILLPPSGAVPGQAGKVFSILALTASGSFTDDDEKQSLLTTVKISAEEPSCQATDDLWKQQQHFNKKRCNWINAAIIACLWVTYVLCNVAYSMISPFFPQIAEKRGASPWMIGLVMGSAPLCVVLTSPLLGYVLPYFKTWCQIFLALVLIGASYLALGFATKVPTLWGFIGACVALRLLEGVGTALLTTATFSTFPNLYPKSVGTLVGLFEIAAGLGYTAGPSLGGVLFEHGGYRLPFISVGGSVLFFAIPCTLLFLLLRKISFVYEKKTIPLRIVRGVFTDLPFITLVLIVASAYNPSSVLAPSLPQFLDNEFRVSPLQIGILYLIGSASYLIAALPVGPFTDKFGYNKSISLFGMVVIAIGYLMIGIPYYLGFRNMWLIRFAYVVFAAGDAICVVPIYGLLLAIGKRYMKPGDNMAGLSSFISGLIASAGSFSLFLGPLVGGITAIVPIPMCTILLSEAFIAESDADHGLGQYLGPSV